MPARQNTHKNTSGHNGARQGYFNKKKFDAARYKGDEDKLHPSVISASTSMCCRRCADKIKWKLDYAKYQEHTGRARKCNACSAPAVGIAYHRICQECARKLCVCAKCQLSAAVSEERGLREQYEARASGSDDDDEEGDAERGEARARAPAVPVAGAPTTAPTDAAEGAPAKPQKLEGTEAAAKAAEEWFRPHDDDDDELRALAGLDVHRLRAHKRKIRDEEEKVRLAALRERERRTAQRQATKAADADADTARGDDDDDDDEVMSD